MKQFLCEVVKSKAKNGSVFSTSKVTGQKIENSCLFSLTHFFHSTRQKTFFTKSFVFVSGKKLNWIQVNHDGFRFENGSENKVM